MKNLIQTIEGFRMDMPMGTGDLTRTHNALLDRVIALIKQHEQQGVDMPTEATNEMIIAALEASLQFRKERGLDDVQPDSAGGIPAEMVRVVYRAMRPYLKQQQPVSASVVEFLNSFSLAVAKDSFYKDVYLNLHNPHSLTMRIANDSSKSWIFADLEERRKKVLAAMQGETQDKGE